MLLILKVLVEIIIIIIIIGTWEVVIGIATMLLAVGREVVVRFPGNKCFSLFQISLTGPGAHPAPYSLDPLTAF